MAACWGTWIPDIWALPPVLLAAKHFLTSLFNRLLLFKVSLSEACQKSINYFSVFVCFIYFIKMYAIALVTNYITAIANSIWKYWNVDMEIFTPLHLLQSSGFSPFSPKISCSFYISYAIFCLWGKMWFLLANKYTQMDLIRSGCQLFLSGIFLFIAIFYPS